jgi:hypothetical protein
VVHIHNEGHLTLKTDLLNLLLRCQSLTNPSFVLLHHTILVWHGMIDVWIEHVSQTEQGAHFGALRVHLLLAKRHGCFQR